MRIEFPDQGLNLHPLHWELESQPLVYRDVLLPHCLQSFLWEVSLPPLSFTWFEWCGGGGRKSLDNCVCQPPPLPLTDLVCKPSGPTGSKEMEAVGVGGGAGKGGGGGSEEGREAFREKKNSSTRRKSALAWEE